MSATVTSAPRAAMRKAMSPVPPGHVEHRLARLRLHPADELVLPQPVQAARHRVVHHVVLAATLENTAPTRRVFSSASTVS
jgi:hypothetical protein